ncbi:MAG: hypothetical protein HWN65_15900 [Candidatus Helarchaeota archaeon]|nr:hypothetical protein [Candidatus Helarchaeota archaeon]
MIRTHCGTCSKLEPPYPVNEPCAKCGGSHLSYGEVDSCVYSTATALTLQELIYYLAETFSEDYQVPYPDLVTLLQEVREQLMEYVRALHGDPST